MVVPNCVKEEYVDLVLGKDFVSEVLKTCIRAN